MKSLLNFTIAFFLSIIVSYGQFNTQFQNYLEGLMIFIDEEIDPVGLSISVRSNDNVWNDVIGISSIDDSLTTSSKLAMGSITKTFTSAAILKLMEENKLSLSDPLHFYLPTYENIDSTITIKQLLYHTSGIFNYSNHPNYFDAVFSDENQFYTFTPEEVLEQFVLEKVFEKGTKQEYCNTNYLLLGMIITEIAERPFYEEIFETFNTTQNYPSFSYPPFNSEMNELANLWYDIGEGTENLSEKGIGLDGLFSSAGSAGAFVATASDLSKWGYDLYSGKLLSASSMDSLFDYHPLLLAGVDEYGLGVFNVDLECDVNAVGHGGNILYASDLAYSEDHDLTVAIMTNDEVGFNEFGGVSSITQEIFCAYEEILMTSSNDIVENAEVEIYPNPVSDILNINLPTHFDQSVQAEVYNEIGTLVYNQNLRNDDQQILQLDCFSGLANGFYFIKLYDKENSYTEKLIKM